MKWFSFVMVVSGLIGCDKAKPPQTVGGTCDDAGAGCSGGEYCLTLVSGGYCTANCTTSGTTAGCPEGSVCDTVSNVADGGTGTAIMCIKSCSQQSDCRADAGQTCNGVSGGSGKGCRPT